MAAYNVCIICILSLDEGCQVCNQTLAISSACTRAGELLVDVDRWGIQLPLSDLNVYRAP